MVQAEDNLIFDVIFTILLMLPPKDLLKASCVCKAWRHLITSSFFIKEYSKKSASKPADHILYMRSRHVPQISNFHLLEEGSYGYSLSLRIPFESDTQSYSIIGFSNGLLCLTDLISNNYGRTIYFCNPSLGRQRIVRSTSLDLHQAVDVALGFSYHKETNDYKVVRIVYRDNGSRIEAYGAEVYIFSTDSWRTIEIGEFPWFTNEYCPAVVLNESLHWICTKVGPEEYSVVILKFDLGTEAFSEKGFPRYHDDMMELGYVETLGVHDGQLAIFLHIPSDELWAFRACYLWVMQDYMSVDSWKILHTVQLEGCISRALSFTTKGIMLEDEGGEFLVYDFLEDARYYIGIRDEVKELIFVPFTHSLVLADEPSRE